MYPKSGSRRFTCCSNTLPGSSFFTCPICTDIYAVRGAFHGCEGARSFVLRDDHDDLALVGDVEWVEAQHLAGRFDRLADRDGLFVQPDAHVALAGDLVQGGCQPTAGGSRSTWVCGAAFNTAVMKIVFEAQRRIGYWPRSPGRRGQSRLLYHGYPLCQI